MTGVGHDSGAGPGRPGPATRALARIGRGIDRVTDLTGRAASRLVVPMVAVAFAVVVLRYGVGIGMVWMQELYVWLHSSIFMLAAAYNLLHEGHVRVDVFRRRMRARTRALVDLIGCVLLLAPVVGVVWWFSYGFVARSWRAGEISSMPGGMHGVYLHKSVILVFCVLVGLQGVALAIRSWLALRGAASTGTTDGAR